MKATPGMKRTPGMKGTPGFRDVLLLRSCTPGLRRAQISEGEKQGHCSALEWAPKTGGATGGFGGQEPFRGAAHHQFIQALPQLL